MYKLHLYIELEIIAATHTHLPSYFLTSALKKKWEKSMRNILGVKK